MSKTFTEEDWNNIKCTLDENGTLTINTEGKNIVIEVTNDEYGNVITPWSKNRGDVKSVIIKGHISFSKGSNLSRLFSNFYNCESFDNLENFDTTEVVNMSLMFYMNSSNNVLKILNLSNWKTSNVQYMTSMFSGCSGLKSLDLSNFNTTKVKIMYCMFQGCSGLKSLDLSNFNTTDVFNMTGMFQHCSSLTSIITPKEFDTNNKTITQLYNLCNNWYDIKGNQLTNLFDVNPKMLYCKDINQIHKSLTKLDFSVNNRCYYKLDNNVLTIYPIIHPNIGYSLTELRTEIESNIPNITKVIIKGYN